jgi:hypothetical protein
MRGFLICSGKNCMQKEQKPEVVLLIKDASERDALGQELVKFGFKVVIETSFDSTWERLTSKTPELLIVDVTAFSSGKRNFSSHPVIAGAVLPVVIYFDETTRPLVYTLPAMFTLGEVERTPNYEPVIKRIQTRLESLSRKEKKVFEQSVLIKKLEELNSDLFNKVTRHESEKVIVEGLVKCCQGLIKAKADSQSFYESLAIALESFPGLESYSLIELGLDKSSLFAPQLDGGKCRPLNRLSMPHLCQNGLTPYAQQLAIQAFSMNGQTEIISLSFYMDQANPQAMLLLTPVEKYDRQYVWDILEDAISNFYWRSFSGNKVVSRSENLAPGIFLEQVQRDNNQFRVVEIDLFKILILSTDRNNGEVAWGNLQDDLIVRTKSLCGVQAYYSIFGLDKIYVAVERTEFDDAFRKIQSSTAKFPYWKYFSKMNFDFSKGQVIEVRECLANGQAIIGKRLNDSVTSGVAVKSGQNITFQLEN